MKARPIAERFWDSVNKNGPVMRPELGPCWVWTGLTDRKGYGRLCLHGHPRLASRVAWEIARGKIPPGTGYHGTVVRHRCDNPPCVNPAHLELGTQADNIADRTARGRWQPLCGDRNGARLHPEALPRGENRAHAKLTAEGVRAIRERHSTGETMTSLAAQFGVSLSLVSHVCRGRTWKHVEGNSGQKEPWTDAIVSWLSSARPQFVTTHDVLVHALGRAEGNWGHYETSRVGRVLLSLGWTRARRRGLSSQLGYIKLSESASIVEDGQ